MDADGGDPDSANDINTTVPLSATHPGAFLKYRLSGVDWRPVIVAVPPIAGATAAVASTPTSLMVVAAFPVLGGVVGGGVAEEESTAMQNGLAVCGVGMLLGLVGTVALAIGGVTPLSAIRAVVRAGILGVAMPILTLLSGGIGLYVGRIGTEDLKDDDEGLPD